MACFSPLDCWLPKKPNEAGNYPPTFLRQFANLDLPMKLPCKKCIGCKLEHSRQIGLRAYCQSLMHENNCFITLTYDKDMLPYGSSVQLDHFQKFLKRLRKKIAPLKIKFLHCGEYGEKFKRPHYHAVLFNYDFPDKTPYQKTDQQHILYTSDLLSKTWGLGRCDLGAVSFNSAQYCARYTLKKFTHPEQDKVDAHYTWINEDLTTTIHSPEYSTMSEGLGKSFFLKYKSDIYPKDFLTINGSKSTPPLYFDQLLKDTDEYLYDVVKTKRASLRVNEQRPDRDTWKKVPSLLSKLATQEATVTNLNRKL